MCNSLFVNVIVFLQRQNLRFTTEDFVIFFKNKSVALCMTGLHDWRVKVSADQVPILARHCLLTGRYFEP